MPLLVIKPSTWEFPQQPIISNLASSYDILPNNTMLVATNETTTTWNILLIYLPNLGPFNYSGYDNSHVIRHILQQALMVYHWIQT
ncbi:hypothetical protein F8M41_000265 [Gigaspora margarita]|uniref:Uncharacterized protein n=1 Tax=Gigaspora margarita TaxID=4874 RepID=A0A8H4AZR4_GIGMA|nr:hypothetical protein F8M41_000265 [Gigaspora margarita]